VTNGQGIINEGLWRKDKDFQRLPRMAQCTFCQVLSQKDLDTCGVLTLNLDLLAKACDELTVEQLRADFAILEDSRFLFVDYDTDELLVRSYVRLVSARSGPKGKSLAWHSVPKNARLLGSVKLRRELAAELRRVRWKEADELAAEIDPTPQPEPPCKSLQSPFQNESPLQGPSKPHSQVPVQVLVSPSLGSYFGEPPSEFCRAHPNGTDKGCRPCGEARVIHDAWVESKQQNELADRRRAREGCPRCRGTNTFEDQDGNVRPCRPHVTHQEQAHA
jgi:hypothetical protein